MRRKIRDHNFLVAAAPATTLALASMLCAAGFATARAQSLGGSLTDSTLNSLANANTGYTDPSAADPTSSSGATAGTAGTKSSTSSASSANAGATPDLGDITAARLQGDVKTPRDNLRTGSIDGLRTTTENTDSPGIRIGTFIIRPALTQGVGVEKTVSGGSTTTRTYSQTGVEGEITSDWSRHQLKVTGSGIWQKNIAGTGETKPSASLDATLRLDISRDTTVNVTGGYTFGRESSTDPNSVAGASVQSAVHTFSAGIEGIHDFGVIRGTVGASLNRSVYGPATLSDGTLLSLSDRNGTTGELRLRAGYELSPVLIPFVEASAGRTINDQRTDSSGYQRDAHYYAGKAGLDFDFGDKLRGELSAGYKKLSFQDSRLAAIGAMTVDGNVEWSPQRGTNVTLGLSTSIEPSTTAGTSGSTAYQFNASISHEMIDDLVARLSGSSTWWRYSDGTTPDETEWLAGAGLTWSMNRFTDLTADLGWEYTKVQAGDSTTIWSAIAGVKFKR